jgi:hypothetical protein
VATTAELRRSLKFINPELFNKIIQLAESGLISAGSSIKQRKRNKIWKYSKNYYK